MRYPAVRHTAIRHSRIFHCYDPLPAGRGPMSTADTPAVARHRVRVALRRARESRQLTQGQIAEAMEWSLSKVMRIEKGEVSISASDLRVLLDFLDIRDPEEVRQLLTDARTSRSERWS